MKTITYKIDTVTAFIYKVKGGYQVESTSANLAERFCNIDLVTNQATFATVKACKAHADMLSITH